MAVTVSLSQLQRLCPALFAKVALHGSYETDFCEGVTVALEIIKFYQFDHWNI